MSNTAFVVMETYTCILYCTDMTNTILNQPSYTCVHVHVYTCNNRFSVNPQFLLTEFSQIMVFVVVFIGQDRISSGGRKGDVETGEGVGSTQTGVLPGRGRHRP